MNDLLELFKRGDLCSDGADDEVADDFLHNLNYLTYYLIV
jgi:hypothetical protein